MLLQLGQATEVLLLPIGREVLGRPLLVSNEEEDILWPGLRCGGSFQCSARLQSESHGGNTCFKEISSSNPTLIPRHVHYSFYRLDC